MLYQNGSLNTLHNDKTVINKVLNFLIPIKSRLWRNVTIENWRNATIENWRNATIRNCGVIPI